MLSVCDLTQILSHNIVKLCLLPFFDSFIEVVFFSIPHIGANLKKQHSLCHICIAFSSLYQLMSLCVVVEPSH